MTIAARSSEPVWAWMVVGWLAASLAWAWYEARVTTVPEPGPGLADGRDPPQLARMCARELRRLPGIGEGRSIELARLRFRHAPDAGELVLTDLRGIGTITAERVRAWLELHGAPPDLALTHHRAGAEPASEPSRGPPHGPRSEP